MRFSEINESFYIEQVGQFVSWAIQKLGIVEPYPEIELSTDHDRASTYHHTGANSDDNKIWVYIKNRNMVDILRTVFHELVHTKQRQLGLVTDADSYTGSPIESQADILAGMYMKLYGKNNKSIFE